MASLLHLAECALAGAVPDRSGSQAEDWRGWHYEDVPDVALALGVAFFEYRLRPAPPDRAVAGVGLAAGAGPYASQREAFARTWGVGQAHRYADRRELLEREPPDIASSCTSARPRAGRQGAASRARATLGARHAQGALRRWTGGRGPAGVSSTPSSRSRTNAGVL